MVLPETKSPQDRLRKEIKGHESSPEPALQYPESVIALIRISWRDMWDVLGGFSLPKHAPLGNFYSAS